MLDACCVILVPVTMGPHSYLAHKQLGHFFHNFISFWNAIHYKCNTFVRKWSHTTDIWLAQWILMAWYLEPMHLWPQCWVCTHLFPSTYGFNSIIFPWVMSIKLAVHYNLRGWPIGYIYSISVHGTILMLHTVMTHNGLHNTQPMMMYVDGIQRPSGKKAWLSVWSVWKDSQQYSW